MDALNGNINDQHIDLIDIRKNANTLNLAESIRRGLKGEGDGTVRSLPSLLLWDEQGLKYFEQITYSPEYYLTNTEISLLKRNAEEIVRSLEPGSILLELGSGNLRKTNILLEAADRISQDLHYFALDLDPNELIRTIRELDPRRLSNVICHGLLGTYDDALEWLVERRNYTRRSICILMLGSTLGCMVHNEARMFLQDWAVALSNRASMSVVSRDHILLGLDACTDKKKVLHAYNDSNGANYRFILNVIQHANHHLGYDALDPNDWTVAGMWNSIKARHEQYLMPIHDINFEGCKLQKGMQVLVAYSHKYDDKRVESLLSSTKSSKVTRFTNEDLSYGNWKTLVASSCQS